MKTDFFIPKYMESFKCIGSTCVDTCCAGWDINIDEDSLNRYNESSGKVKALVQNKYRKNNEAHDFFNSGFMIVKEGSVCPFLNSNKLCDIHGGVGEENLCITCKSYPRVYNIVDGIYEKSVLPSCDEACRIAFLNKEKMEFIEVEENIDEDGIEIRRIIDTESFEDSDSLLQYFWNIRINSINIMSNRTYSIEERLNILKSFYERLQHEDAYYVLDELEDESFDFNSVKGEAFVEKELFYKQIGNDELVSNIKSFRLKEVIKEFNLGISREATLIDFSKVAYIFENYLVNQIFKDLIPFNRGENLADSINILINTYRIIKSYATGLALNLNTQVDEEIMIRVIGALSKEIEHNKVFKEILSI